MAMFTLIEINGDHLSDLLGKGVDVGMALQTIVRNTSNAPRVLEETDLYRVLRVVKQSGTRYDDKPYPNYSLDADLSLRVPEGVKIVKDGNVGTPDSDAALIRLQAQITHLNKTVEVQARQISALVDTVDETTIMVENDDVRIDVLARRIDALEQWRKA